MVLIPSASRRARSCSSESSSSCPSGARPRAMRSASEPAGALGRAAKSTVIAGGGALPKPIPLPLSGMPNRSGAAGLPLLAVSCAYRFWVTARLPVSALLSVPTSRHTTISPLMVPASSSSRQARSSAWLTSPRGTVTDRSRRWRGAGVAAGGGAGSGGGAVCAKAPAASAIARTGVNADTAKRKPDSPCMALLDKPVSIRLSAKGFSRPARPAPAPEQ